MALTIGQKKVLAFGAIGALGCFAGWLIGEAFLAMHGAVAGDAGPSLVARTAEIPDAPPPPPEFKERLDAAGAKTGDIQISLLWNNRNDLDLHCIEPSGEEIFYPKEHRRSRSGGELDVDRNAAPPLTDKPVENIYWNRGTAPEGKYQVYVHFFARQPDCPATTPYKVNVLYGSKREEFNKEVTWHNGRSEPQQLVFEFEIKPQIDVLVPADVKLSAGRGPLKVPVTIRRNFYRGPVMLNVADLPKGVTATGATIAAEISSGEIALNADSISRGSKISLRVTAAGGSAAGEAALPLTLRGDLDEISIWSMIPVSVWTAIIAAGLTLALMLGQNWYSGRPLIPDSRWPLTALGGAAAGFLSGAFGQGLFFACLAIGFPTSLGYLAGWMLLGALLGCGVSYVIPNLDAKKAAFAGLAGGLIGVIAFLVFSSLSNVLGRFAGAEILGFCIGLMVAAVEVAFRSAWLEVKLSARETIAVNLGPEPVKLGGDSRQCNVWAKGAAPIALKYWLRDGKVICVDTAAGTGENVVPPGDCRTAGSVEVTVRTSGTAPNAAPPPRPVAVPPPIAPPPVAVAPPPRPTTAAPPTLRPPTPLAAPAKPAAAPASADGCPGCGRKVAGRPGARYCVVCDRNY